MIVAKICGGLGNQMFQYAAGYALSKLHKTQLYLDLHELAHDSLRDYSLGVFNIGASVASDEQITSLTKYKVSKFGNKLDKIVSKIGFRYYRNYYRERYFSYDSEFLRLPDDVLNRLKELSHDVVSELAEKNKAAQRIYDSYNKFYKQVSAWHEISEKIYFNVR